MFFEWTDIWFTGYHLLVVSQLLLRFVVEVTERSRQVETTIHPAHVDCAPCFLYSCLLLLTLGLVVDWEIYGFAAPAERTSRVASVGYNVVGRGDEDHVGSAPCCFGDGIGLWHVSECV